MYNLPEAVMFAFTHSDQSYHGGVGLVKSTLCFQTVSIRNSLFQLCACLP